MARGDAPTSLGDNFAALVLDVEIQRVAAHALRNQMQSYELLAQIEGISIEEHGQDVFWLIAEGA